jgi:hypothetical protein
MSRVFNPTVYKPLPPGAEVVNRKGQRIAKWTDKRGRMRTAPVAVPKRGRHAGEPRIVVESRLYWCEYWDKDGLRPVPTGCHDETAARGRDPDWDRPCGGSAGARGRTAAEGTACRPLRGRAVPMRLPVGAPLLDVPGGMVKRFNHDLVAAGIAVPIRDGGKWRTDKEDAMGRVLDVHCLRTTFNSLLAAARVPLTTRRILMRHAGAA